MGGWELTRLAYFARKEFCAMTEDELVDADLADLYGAYLIFRQSDQGVEGFRKYMRHAFNPEETGFDQAVSNIIAEFARVAAGETTAIH